MDKEQFDRKFLAGLNSQQREAVRAVEGPVLLLATPGSGKTTVLVIRLGYMIECCGIDPRSILTMTYTRAATMDMRLRFAEYFGEGLAGQLQFRTINGVSAVIIRKVGKQHGREPFVLLEEGERNRILRSVWQTQYREYPEESDIREAGTAITYIKNMMLSAEEIGKLKSHVDNLPAFYSRYQEELRKRRAMDYDDQMRYALRLLRRFPDVLEDFRKRYRYLCVDEAQDSSRLQHEIIRVLASGDRNLFMVGDEDQSIYAFRAAYPEALLGFNQFFPEARVLLMEENYRSTPEIIRAANRFIARSDRHREKTIVPTRGPGAPVRILPVWGREGQFDYLLKAAPGWNRQTAVLFRNNDSALPLIERFEAAGISYNCRSFEDLFFTHRVVNDIVDCLRFSLDSKDTECFLRIYCKLGACISKKEAQAAANTAAATGKAPLAALLAQRSLRPHTREMVRTLQRDFDMMRKDTAGRALQRIWERMHYGRYVERHGMDTGKYSVLCMLAKGVPDVRAFLEKLEGLRKTITEHQNAPKNKIILSTIHSSKGLEYDRVFLLDMTDGIIPSKTMHETEEERREYEEERRMFYVAMTRAKDELTMFRMRGSSFPDEIAEYCRGERRASGISHLLDRAGPGKTV